MNGLCEIIESLLVNKKSNESKKNLVRTGKPPKEGEIQVLIY